MLFQFPAAGPYRPAATTEAGFLPALERINPMKKAALVLMLILFAGCAASDEFIRTKNRENLLRLSVGMKKFEVLQIMGTQTFEAINNPYKVETQIGRAHV